MSQNQARSAAPSIQLQPSSPSTQKPGTLVSQSSERLGQPLVLATGGAMVGGNDKLTPMPANRPSAFNFQSAPAVPGIKPKPPTGLAAKRGLGRGLKLSNASGPPGASQDTERRAGEIPKLDDSISAGVQNLSMSDKKPESIFDKYSEIVDTRTGSLNFKGKATIHGKGIDFSGGTSFSISLDEVENLEELGKGNYGTVYRVRHSRPQMRRPGLGLGGIKHAKSQELPSPIADDINSGVTPGSPRNAAAAASPTGVVMAMKEIRLELDEAKFAAIIMELDILHRCVSPFIIDFYGAFFQEGAVYICMEYMDGGSVDKLYGDGIPEGVLRKITMSTIMGLKSLKDDHNIIHRDVKPTNVLVNTRGQVKICDFGVSGNLVASIAKTNIGCQSYMAPERIASGGMAQVGVNPAGGTYSVQSDIWSLGLSIIECAMGQYPYPPETYNNIFSQLSVSL